MKKKIIFVMFISMVPSVAMSMGVMGESLKRVVSAASPYLAGTVKKVVVLGGAFADLMAINACSAADEKEQNVAARKALESYGVDLDSTLKAMQISPQKATVTHVDDFFIGSDDCKNGTYLVDGFADPAWQKIALKFPTYRGQPEINKTKTASALLFTLAHEAAHLRPENRNICRLGWLGLIDLILDRKKYAKDRRAQEKAADLAAVAGVPMSLDGGIRLMRLVKSLGYIGGPWHPTFDKRIAYFQDVKDKQERDDRRYGMRYWVD